LKTTGPDGPLPFEDFEIQIKVSFRDGVSVKVLNSHTQSGGERAVSTMLYLIALQEFTKCPFRLVDEINQGMDPLNERNIFDVVANVACQTGLPQYFLITPKLLPDLNFTKGMTVLCVYNGPYTIPHTEWNMSKFIEAKKKNTPKKNKLE